MARDISLFLDSGAYSLYMNLMLKKGGFSEKEYSQYFEDYILFIKKNEKYVDVYVNLDVINDPVASMKNYKKMTSQGLKPISVVHPGEDPIWIDKYLDLGCEYLGLGGVGKFFTKNRYIEWADEVWEKHICDSKGFPKAKVHGFGTTSLELMLRWPWWSVDSTSWIQTGQFGRVYVPRVRNGVYFYHEQPWIVVVSNQSPSQKDEGQHFTTSSKMEQNVIENYFKLKGFVMGKSETHEEDRKTYKLKRGERWVNNEDADSCCDLIENIGTFVPPEKLAIRNLVETVIIPGVSNDYKQRDELNIIYYLDLEALMPKWPWAWKPKQSRIGFSF